MNIIDVLNRFKDTVAYYAQNGIDLQTVSKAESKNRMEICKSCKIKQPDGTEIDGLIKPFLNCRECGCFMVLKTKLLFDPVESGMKQEQTKTACPLGKW